MNGSDLTTDQWNGTDERTLHDRLRGLVGYVAVNCA